MQNCSKLSTELENSPEYGGVADVLGLQGHALQELIAEAVVKGAV